MSKISCFNCTYNLIQLHYTCNCEEQTGKRVLIGINILQTQSK